MQDKAKVINICCHIFIYALVFAHENFGFGFGSTEAFFFETVSQKITKTFSRRTEAIKSLIDNKEVAFFVEDFLSLVFLFDVFEFTGP